jgi:hypothetical protein
MNQVEWGRKGDMDMAPLHWLSPPNNPVLALVVPPFLLSSSNIIIPRTEEKEKVENQECVYLDDFSVKLGEVEISSVS